MPFDPLITHRLAGPAVVPLVPRMQEAMERELAMYQRIVTAYPQVRPCSGPRGPALHVPIMCCLHVYSKFARRTCGAFRPCQA